MNWLPTIHPVTVVVTTFGSLLGAALMLSALEIRERTLAAKPRRKDGSLTRRAFRRVSLCDRTRSGLTPNVPLAIARVLASAA
jgi:hypothetical protein